MTTLDIAGLTGNGFSILRLSADGWLELRETRAAGSRFTLVFPHGVARIGKPGALVLVVTAGSEVQNDGSIIGLIRGGPVETEPQMRLGWIRSIQAVATQESRVSFDYVQPIEPNSLAELMGDAVPASLRVGADRMLASDLKFERVSPKLGQWFLKRLVAQPSNAAAFRRLIAVVERPTRYHGAVALQEDALTLALKAFGAATAAATSLALGDRRSALAGARLQEDVVIEHDARWLPGWTLDSSDLTGRAVFTRGREELRVFTANKQPLERLFGVDLIYLNETRRSIVMVQYKMMEPLKRRNRQIEADFWTFKETDEQKWIVPIDQQFRDEMARMERFNRPASAYEPGNYRMNSSPFFFKFVRRYGATGGSGILLNLSHLKQLLTVGLLHGPRGGLGITYSKLNGHYLRGETFIDLVRSGYIGSHSATTDHLQTLIEFTLSGGRAAVAAIQRVLPDTR